MLEAGKEFGILPCGLGARNTLRLESGMALYGHEISDEINVFEAHLDRFCKLEKGRLLSAREALKQVKAAGGPKRKLVGLEMVERGIGRDGYPVFSLDGKQIGYVTSGSPAPFLKKNIALAYVPLEFTALDTEVLVQVRSQHGESEGDSHSVLPPPQKAGINCKRTNKRVIGSLIPRLLTTTFRSAHPYNVRRQRFHGLSRDISLHQRT